MATVVETRPTATVQDVPGKRIWGATRIGLGLIFLWAFFDKLLALGFATGRAEDGSIDFLGPAAWVNGGSPTYGFLTYATKGPLAGFFQSLAGQAWVDWLFMLGLLGIGVALTFGVAVRLGAGAGIVMLMLMWLAVLPPTYNPILDDHIIYSLVLAGLAAVNAGDYLGLGKKWASLPIVKRYPILR